jgi:hypothetical protein
MRNRQKAAKVRQMLRHHAAGVKGYKEADKILDELTDVMKPGDSVLIGGGQKATLVDLFQEKKSIFVGRMARRFEMKISPAES